MKFALAAWIAWGGIYGTLRCLVFSAGYFFGPYTIRELQSAVDDGLGVIEWFVIFFVAVKIISLTIRLLRATAAALCLAMKKAHS